MGSRMNNPGWIIFNANFPVPIQSQMMRRMRGGVGVHLRDAEYFASPS